MDTMTLRAVFLWCTIIDGTLLILSFLICACAGGWIHQVHSKWFPISRETFNVAIYCFIGLFKILFLVFNLVPYIALVIVG